MVSICETGECEDIFKSHEMSKKNKDRIVWQGGPPSLSVNGNWSDSPQNLFFGVIQ